MSTSGVVSGLMPGLDTIRYTVTVAGCSTTMILPVYVRPHSICAAGISIVSNSTGDVVIYPNPVNDELIINFAEKGSAIKLFNILGQQVYIGVVDTDMQTISTRELLTGSYMLQTTDRNGNRINRTVVKR